MSLINLSADSGPVTEPMLAPLDDDALPPGSVVGGCQIVEPVSRDDMSILYLATDSTLQRDVLIREHYPSRLVSRHKGPHALLIEGADEVARADALEAFLQEGRLLVRLDHPSIAKVHRFWEQNQTAYMMMPFYQGESLDAVLERIGTETSHEAWLRQVLSSLLGAVGALHAADCFHLAVSPENVWMTPEGVPMLLDLSASNQVVGELRAGSSDSVDRAYAPIEQFSHGAQFPLGPWTDLYAVAAIAYQAVLGRPPTSAAILGVNDSIVPLGEALAARGPRYAKLAYHPTFLAAIDKALSVKPQDRPQSAAEFQAALNDSEPLSRSAEEASAPTVLPHQPGPDGRALEADSDPAAAAAIALAISSLPWVASSRQDPAGQRPDEQMPPVLLDDDESRRGPASTRDLREPLFEDVTAPAPQSEGVWADLPSSGAASAAAPSRQKTPPRAPKTAHGGRWATAIAMAGLAVAVWYGSTTPAFSERLSRWMGGSAPLVAAAPQSGAPVGPATAAPATPPVTPAGVAAAKPDSPVALNEAAASPAGRVAGIDAGLPGSGKAGAVVTANAQSLDADEKLVEAEPPTLVDNRVKKPAPEKAKPAERAFTPDALPATAAGPVTPRGACGSRANFALVYCMQTQCKRPGFAKHAQCVAFLRDGEVN